MGFKKTVLTTNKIIQLLDKCLSGNEIAQIVSKGWNYLLMAQFFHSLVIVAVGTCSMY